MQTFIAAIIGGIVTLLFVRRHLIHLEQRDAAARVAAERGKVHSEGPRAQHPQIDAAACIGCATCTTVCPEGDVLAMIGGKAMIVNGHKCIGHGICAEACPVGAITMVMASPGVGADMPVLTAEYETSVPNLFIAGELGGLALIKNAINHGRECIDTIAARRNGVRDVPPSPGIYEVLIIGAGPAGISASLRAAEKKLNYLTLEQDEIGGTVAKYPRQKLVLTSPVEFPLYGKFKRTEISKEELLAFWNKVLQRADFNVRTNEKVKDIQRNNDGIFTVTSSSGQFRSRAVILGLGRGGTPRKLGVTGEGLPKVMYRLIEADHYVNKRILVVGGGDSAVEAAMGLAQQSGNEVILSYRKEAFTRIKERNAHRIELCRKTGNLEVLFESNPVEFKTNSVVLNIRGELREIPNDYVWIFAGGDPPNSFLKKIGIAFGARDLTKEGCDQAKAVVEIQTQEELSLA